MNPEQHFHSAGLCLILGALAFAIIWAILALVWIITKKLWRAVVGLLSCFAFSSCVIYQDKATSASGNTETTTYASLGGTGTVTGANGNHMTHDHQTSFRDGTTAVTTVAGGVIAGSVSKANTASKNTAATTQQLNQQNFQLGTQKEADAASAAAAKGKLIQQAQANGQPIPLDPN